MEAAKKDNHIQKTGLIACREGKDSDECFYEKYPELSASFKIGIEKLYVLKSIPKLIDAHKQHKSMKFGKSYVLSFMDNDFDEKSGKYYSIIEAVKSETDYIQDKYGIGRGYYDADSSLIGDAIDLNAEHLDDFYELVLNLA